LLTVEGRPGLYHRPGSKQCSTSANAVAAAQSGCVMGIISLSSSLTYASSPRGHIQLSRGMAIGGVLPCHGDNMILPCHLTRIVPPGMGSARPRSSHSTRKIASCPAVHCPPPTATPFLRQVGNNDSLFSQPFFMLPACTATHTLVTLPAVRLPISSAEHREMKAAASLSQVVLSGQ
jgi:hypothetical protein